MTMLEAYISQNAKLMGIGMSEAQARQFSAYHALLEQGNARMNLTRVPLDDVREQSDRNYLDSIAPLTVAGLFADTQKIVDVGAGAGFPGIPLSIMLPQSEFVLLDALRKRVDFLSETIAALGLRARAQHIRAEDAGHSKELRAQFDVAVARAVASLPVLLELCMPLVKVGGHFIAYKGPSLDEEIAQSAHAILALGGAQPRVFPVTIPGREEWSHRLCVIQKMSPTPKCYPRKASDIQKKPFIP